MFRFLLLSALLVFPVCAGAQQVRWLDTPIDKTQTLSFDLAFGQELTLITKIAAADLELRALATHSLELIDGTVMAAILRTQPEITFANSGGAYARWETDTRVFQELGLIEEDDFAITLSMPAIDGADFVPDVKLELVLKPIVPETNVTFLETASLSGEVRGAGDYGLSDFQGATLYPNADLATLVTLRDLPLLSMARQPGRCENSDLVRTVYATVSDLGADGALTLANFPQECWRGLPEGVMPGDIADDSGYQPDIRVRLAENGGEVIGFVFGATSGQTQRLFIQNTSAGWLYGTGDGNWERIGNGTRTDVPFGNGVLAIRNPRGGETDDATENDAFVAYLIER